MFWYSVVFVFIVGNMLSFMLDGTSGIVATTLTSAISPTDRYVPLASTTGFLASDNHIFIEDEEITYTAINTGIGTCSAFTPPCFDTGSTGRGTNNTTAASHANGEKVMSETVGLLNQVVGFRIAEVNSVIGFIKLPLQLGFAVLKFSAKFVMWDYSFLTGNAVWIKYILLYPFSAAFVIALLNVIKDTVQGILKI